MQEIRSFVSSSVRSMSGGFQNPVVDRDNIYQNVDFLLRQGWKQPADFKVPR